MTLRWTECKEDTVRDALIASIGCGDDGLITQLEDNFQVIWCMSQMEPYPEIQYLRAQLSLLDLAMLFTRNQIDDIRARASSDGEGFYHTEDWRRSKSQRSAQSTSCGWSESTNFQQFRRDSEEVFNSRSDKNGSSVGTSLGYGYDRSSRFGGGQAVTWSDSQNRSEGLASSYNTYCAFGRGKDLTTTSQQWPEDAVVPGVNIAKVPPYIVFAGPEVGIPRIFVTCTPLDLENDASPNTCEAPAISSTARSWEIIGDIAVSFGIAGIFSLSTRISIKENSHVKVTWLCSSSCYISRSTTEGASDRYDVSLTESIRHSESGESTTTINDVLSHSESMRHGETHTGEGSAGASKATAETHSGSDRVSHAEGQSGSQSSASSQNELRASGFDRSGTEGYSEAIYWSQIFENLQSMWEMVFDQIKDFTTTRSSSLCGQVGYMTTKNIRTPCTIRGNRVILKNTWRGYAL